MRIHVLIFQGIGGQLDLVDLRYNGPLTRLQWCNVQQLSYIHLDPNPFDRKASESRLRDSIP